MASKDPQVRREAWARAREQAAKILGNDLTHETFTDAAMELAEAFRDLDPGEREPDNPVLGPRGLDNVVISHHLEGSGSFDIAVDHKIVAMIPAATLAALVMAVTAQDAAEAQRWRNTLGTCIADLRRILYRR